MSDYEYPRLCGGIFFTLVLQALKQRMKAREHYRGESDGLSDPEVLTGLIQVVNPDYREVNKTVLKGAANAYKTCKISSGIYLPFGDKQEIYTFDKRVKTNYSAALQDMETFVNRFIDVGDAVQKHVTLVKALADLVIQDDLIKSPDDAFYINPEGQTTKKADFPNLREVYLPAFLLGIWHYAATVRKDNTIGEETYNRWCPPAGGGLREYTGHMGEQILKELKVRVSRAPDSEDAGAEPVSSDQAVYEERPKEEGGTQIVPDQTVINNQPTFFNISITGNNHQFIQRAGTVIVYNGGETHE